VHAVCRSKRSTSLGLFAASALCFITTGLPSTRAEAQSGPDGLEYSAPPGCPSRGEWLERVRERLAGTTGRWSSERLAAIPARVTLSAAGSEARIVFHGGGVERSIAGADCEEVASAAALIFSVALGASASNGAGAPESAASGAVARRAAVVAPVVSPAEASVVGVPSGGSDASIDAPPESPSDAGHRRWAVALGASAEANAWTGPWPAGVFGASFDAVSPSRGWGARAALGYGSGERVVDGRRAEFQYWGGHLDLCPIALGAITAWRWDGCAELHLGLLRAEGDESSALASGSSRRAWLATAAATTRLITPPLWALRLQVETGVALPLVRQTFQFGAPEQVLFESPAAGLLARAGLLVPLDGQPD
jgi:hypothetical protein